MLHPKLSRRALLGLALAPSFSFAQASPPAKTQGASTLSQLWAEFRGKYVRKDGSVTDTGNQGITHTEGLGVAMLFAQEVGDLKSFELLASFARRLMRADGLHSWKWSQGAIADKNNASDGDVYLAWAFLRAALKWNRTDYLTQARKIVLGLEQHCVVDLEGKQYLLPGIEGFIQSNASRSHAVLNPSYWVFPAFREFRAIGTDSLWRALHSNARALLQSAPWSPSGLPADWVAMQDPINAWRERPARFGYEAIRVPLFLVWDGLEGERGVRAAAEFMANDRFPAWTSLDRMQVADYPAPSGFKAVASLVRRAVYGTPIQQEALDGDYYSSSLVLLSAMAAAQRGWL